MYVLCYNGKVPSFVMLVFYQFQYDVHFIISDNGNKGDGLL